MDALRKCPVCSSTRVHAVVNDHWHRSHPETGEKLETIDAGCWCDDCHSDWKSIDDVIGFAPYDVEPHRYTLED